MPTHDPRPVNWKEQAQQYRKVIPPDLVALAGELPPRPPRASLSSGLNPYTGPWTSVQVAHLLKRTMFGVTKADLNYFISQGMENSIRELLTKQPLPPLPVNDYDGIDGVYDPHVRLGQSWVNTPYSNTEGNKILSMKAWNMTRLTEQERSIHAKMYMFWMNHFSIQSWDIFFGKALWPYYRTLWSYSMGNFKDFVKQITVNSAMLVSLNGFANTKDGPDENYARELQELFCVGKGPDAGYTESDVQQAARVLTGWQVRWSAYNEMGTPFDGYFNEWLHETSDKQFSSFYGNRVIQGRRGPSGAQEVDELLDMIFDTHEVARFIVRKIYTYFVYHAIDDQVERDVIIPLSDQFRSSGYDIKTVLDILFRSEHFFDAANYGAMIKTPFDQTIGFWRMMGNQYNDNDLNTRYLNNTGLLWNQASLGQEMNDPPNVSGWAPFYQAPGFDKLWITTETIKNRAIATDSFIWWGYWNPSGQNINADVLSFTEGLDDPGDPNSLIAEVVEMSHGIDITDASRLFLKGILLSGQNDDFYWTQAWSDYITDPGNPDPKAIVENRLKVMYQNLFQLAESQLM